MLRSRLMMTSCIHTRCLLAASLSDNGAGAVQKRHMGRRQPKQGKPPILPPSKKVLYHVVHTPWQKPEDVEELLWRRHAYNNAVVSLREVFRAELAQNASHGQGIESMKEAEAEELNNLILENQKLNEEKKAARTARESDDAKETKTVILEEIRVELEKRNDGKKRAEQEVKEVIARAHEFVDKDNLEMKILEALENPIIYDFAIDRAGNKYFVPEPVKYQEGTPTRQKGRLYDQTLGTQLGTMEEGKRAVEEAKQ